MYGMVNNAMEQMVVTHHGREKWEEIKAKAGVETEVFISNEGYDDRVTYDLVAAASEVLDQPADLILHAFGEHWILHTGREGYGALFEACGKTLPDFLKNLPNFHTRVKLMLPALQPPRFEVSDETPNSLRLHYHSPRPGLTAFVTGLISGLGRMFSTPAACVLERSKEAGDSHDVFLVSWKTEAP